MDRHAPSEPAARVRSQVARARSWKSRSRGFEAAQLSAVARRCARASPSRGSQVVEQGQVGHQAVPSDRVHEPDRAPGRAPAPPAGTLRSRPNTGRTE